MKTIGLLGGMSWESTLSYYRILNESVNRELGGLHSAKILLSSLDFSPIAALQEKGEWEEIAAILSAEARILERAGAQLLLLCSNTAHRVFEEVRSSVSIDMLHVADALGISLRAGGVRRALLLGTGYTLGSSFLTAPLQAGGMSILLPEKEQRKELDRIIFGELCRGRRILSSKQWLQDRIEAGKAEGAQGVILGCTELSLLLKAEESALPLFDTTRLHAQRAAALALR